MKRAFGIVGLLVAGGLVACALGFAWFVTQASRPMPPPSHADGIVALTGGADRVETALRLLTEGRADKLLVSGIGGNIELGTLARRAGVDPGPIAAEVTLGRDATTTRGNAAETAAWAKENAIHSLIVVTAGYHMPRALAEIGRAAPDLTLYPVPVLPHTFRETGAAGRAAHLRLMAEEYAKFLAASVDLTALLPEHRPRDDGSHEGGAREDRTHEAGPHEVGPHEVGTHEDGAHDDRPRDSGSHEDGARAG